MPILLALIIPLMAMALLMGCEKLEQGLDEPLVVLPPVTGETEVVTDVAA